MKALTVFFISVFFFSCSNKGKKNSLILFENVIEIGGEKYQNEIVVTAFPQTGKLQAVVKPLPVPVLLPRFMGIVGEHLIVYKQKEQMAFALFRLPDCFYIGDRGNWGQGPDDFNLLDTRSFCLTENGFKVLEAGSNLLKTVVIQKDELKVNNSEVIFEQGISNNGFYPLGDSVYLTLGRLEDENEYCLLDNKRGEITKIENYPHWTAVSNRENTPPPFVTYLKNCVVHPDGKRFASFYCRFKRLRIYDQQVRLLHDIDVRVAPYSTNFEEDVRYQPGYYIGQPYATKDYIYTFCENSSSRDGQRNYRCELQVWSWSGRPVACFEFDRKISLIAISWKYNKLYALDNNVEDEMYIYDLPQIKEE